MKAVQSGESLPEGFIYRPDFLSPEEEQGLLARLREIGFSDVNMRGVVARRRVAHFGWIYGYDSWQIVPGPPPPEFLIPVRQRVAAMMQLPADSLAEILITEYPAGAGIGWHRDAAMFGSVAAVSLLSACRLKLRLGKGKPDHVSTMIESRSTYVLGGAARSTWQHSIPPAKEPRYSITFRTLRAKKT